MRVSLNQNKLDGKWFIGYNNQPHEIIECRIDEEEYGSFAVWIRGEKTPWHKADSKNGSSYFVKWIGEKDDVVDYSKTLQNRQLVKNLFCTYVAKGDQPNVEC